MAPDLEYFLRTLSGARYEPLAILAPTPTLLKAYRAKDISWNDYADAYRSLLSERDVEHSIDRSALKDSCLLCSEHLPDKCHRRLAAEHLKRVFAPSFEIQIVHL